MHAETIHVQTQVHSHTIPTLTRHALTHKLAHHTGIQTHMYTQTADTHTHTHTRLFVSSLCEQGREDSGINF